MKNILLIGVGGTGSNAVDMLYRKIEALGQNENNRIVALVFDTDKGDIDKITTATAIPMTDAGTVGTVCDTMSAAALKEWFPYTDANARSQEMVRGASQWRKKSFFAFMNLMNKPQYRSAFHNAMDELRDTNSSSSYEIYTIASIAGGTGSGSFIPITMYAKKYIKEHLGKETIANAVLACPDIYADKQTSQDNATKVYSNAYAILRELNAINLVTHGYNAPNVDAKEHHPPVRYKLGHPSSPVGVLFDSADERFWHPGAAPFQKIYLLDKIPGLNSIKAHDVVLANSLYTVLCTEIGSSIDSEMSNHAMLNSQSNGYNAIYAGIATSELRYPADSVLNYMAHRKALEASSEEWVVIHRATEQRILEEQKLAKESRRIYVENPGDYAKKFLLSVKDRLELPVDNLSEIIHRSTEFLVSPDNGDDKTAKAPEAKKYVDSYVSSLLRNLKERIPEFDMQPFNDSIEKKKFGKRFLSANDREEGIGIFADYGEKGKTELTSYYILCAKTIHDTVNSITDNILTYDPHKSVTADDAMSVVSNLLMLDKQYIHPVPALIQLCELQVRLNEELKTAKSNQDFQHDIRYCDAISELPSAYYKDADSVELLEQYEEKSLYYKLENDRLHSIIIDDPESAYRELGKSCIYNDVMTLIADIKASGSGIFEMAKKQMLNTVLQEVVKRLEALIGGYRNFFNHLEEERENLKEATETALRANSGTSGSVINVASDPKAKKAIYEQLNEAGSSPRMEDIRNAEHIAGLGVFEMVYAIAQSDAADDNAPVNSKAYNSLFDGMVQAYRDQISHSRAYMKQAAKNVFEVVADSCRSRNTEPGDILRAEEQVLRQLVELARPALMVDNCHPDDGTPAPSTVTVLLMSSQIAKYLKRHAELFGLTIDDDKNEDAACRSCAEQFVTRAGGYGIRVAVVDELPASVVYVTSEIIDVQPIHVGKIDELGTNPVYFENYKTAIANMERFETDMWNPHLGFNLHKRGYLPYINPAMEQENDRKLIKALLYAVMEGRITYERPQRQALAYRYYNNGVKKMITDLEGQIVDEKNISSLVSWLRAQTKLVEEWSAAFEANLKKQFNALPVVTSEEEIKVLEANITKSKYITLMRDSLFAVVNREDQEGGNQKPMSLLEFAYAVKTSEEISGDCDDAEKILAVGYEIFCRFCEARLPVKKDPGRYAGVYTQQLDKFYFALRKNMTQVKDEGAAKTQEKLNSMIDWINSAGFFRSIPTENMIDVNGEIRFVNYDLEKALAKPIKTGSAQDNTAAADKTTVTE